MADINIQRKKNTPSPWLLLLLVLAIVGVGAWFLFKAEINASRDLPPPPPPASTPAAPDSLIGAETGPRPDNNAVNELATSAPVTPEVLAAFATSDAGRPGYATEGLRLLTSALVSLADRDDLRTPEVQTRRDDLTSATSRLDEPAARLRPGLVAAASLIETMQQQGYPELEAEVQRLNSQAGDLTGQTATAEQQQALRAYFGRAAALVRALNTPPAVR
ncbi:hypothetical protein CDA63_13805 [Hymenobacter amundsenii]|uniref:Uncharacterized protein n=1 Tax=Hymenobacter amundsenii TaxID=2006685 RepID=A0A246FIW9_9BACT|nr:hypothetical protein [Hymenobacter amundsenii]OWP62468.1 hypothetical protein CDA63_13805 [Hymenobacter amundsenii]